MALAIETFSNDKGGNAFFKAIGHPLAQRKAADLLARLRQGPVALYDPLGYAAAFNEIYDLSDLELESYYVQNIEEIGKSFLGRKARARHRPCRKAVPPPCWSPHSMPTA